MRDEEYEAVYRTEDAHWWYVSLRERIERLVENEAEVKLRTLDILDAGCGTGRLCVSLQRFGSVQGVDASPIALAFCAQRNLVDVSLMDLNTADLGNERYDLITCIDVLCQRWVEDDVAVLRSFFRALRPGGALIVQVPAWPFLHSAHDEAVLTRERYTQTMLRERLADAGFSVERISYRLCLLFSSIAVYRLLRRALRGRPSAKDQVRSDVHLPPRWLNQLLLAIARAENALLSEIPLPFGSSLITLGRKTG